MKSLMSDLADGQIFFFSCSPAHHKWGVMGAGVNVGWAFGRISAPLLLLMLLNSEEGRKF